MLSNAPHAVNSLCCTCLHVGRSECVASIVLKSFKILSFLYNSVLSFGEVIILRLILNIELFFT